MKYLLVSCWLFLTVCCLGQTTFQKIINIDDGEDFPWSIQVLDDGYLICAGGFIDDLDGWTGIKLYKTDFNGNLQWNKFYGEVGLGYFPGNNGSFIKTIDGGFALGGSMSNSDFTNVDPILFKFDANGDSLWVKKYGGNLFDVFRQGRNTEDGGYILTGETKSFGEVSGDVYLVKTDSAGNMEWEKTYGGQALERPWSLEITSDNGYMIAALTESFGLGGAAGYYIRTDSLGNLEWDTTIGTPGSDNLAYLKVASDGNYIIWGNLDTANTQSRDDDLSFVAKLDTGGNSIWWSELKGLGYSFAWQLKELSDRSIVSIGVKDDPISGSEAGWLFKLNSSGQVVWERLYLFDNPNNREKIHLRGDFQQTDDGGFIITGNVWKIDSTGPAFQEILLMKVDSNGCLENDCGLPVSIVEPVISTSNIQLYPNPTSHDLVIEFEIDEEVGRVYFDLYDLTGVRKKAMIFDKHQVRTTINVYDLPSGFYLFTFRSQKGMLHSGKISVQRH